MDQISTTASGNRSADLFTPERKFDPQQHDWVQRGRELSCATCADNHLHGTIIAPGLMLVGSRGKWNLIPQRGMRR